MLRNTARLVLVFVLTSPAVTAVLAAASPALAQHEQRSSDAQLEPFARGLAAYAEARVSTVGADAARVEIEKSLAALAAGLAGGDPLRETADLGRALWLSRDYAGVKVRKGKITTDAFPHGSFAGAGMEFAYRLPKSYDADESYPLILTIPDAEEGPAQHIRKHWTLRDVKDAAIVVCPAMPADPEGWDRIVRNGKPGGLSHVLTGLRLAGERFAVDFDRIYVVGRGKGVPAAIAAGNYSPQRFAGIVGRAGDAADLGPDNFGSLPTYFAGAGAKAGAFQKAAEAADLDNCTLDPSGDEQDVWRWILKHPREAHPASVTVAPNDPTNPFPTRAYWLRIAPSAIAPRATATIEGNTITIDAQDVSFVTLYLNDALVDLDKPLRVVCNGVETSHSIPRKLSSLLGLLYDGTSDAGSVYVAEAVYSAAGEAVSAASEADRADPEYAERLVAAGMDADALWELSLWCRSTGREARGAAALRRLLRASPDHADARKELGHVRAGEHWFTSQAALERFERAQDAQTAEAMGYVEYKSIWMHTGERARVTKGWAKDPETGVWLSPADRKKLDKGWVLQDLDWIAPADAARVDEGLWLVNGEWVDGAEADRRHSKIDSMWRIPGPDVVLYATVDRAVAQRALPHMERAIADMRRVFGAQPPLPLRVALLRDEEQYDRFAFGDPDGARRATHAGRLQIIHSAVFVESWFPLVEGEREFRGMGAAYWDALAPHGDSYGVHAARLAAGLSYVDALDPSPKAVKKALVSGPKDDYYAAYESEKGLPAWLRYGGAVYAERYFEDTTVAESGDPWWARNWSIENLKNKGGLRPLSEVLAFPLDPDQRDASLKLLIEAGLLVAFIVDGDCGPVREKHDAFKRALATGRLHPKYVEALTEALLAHEAELRAFAGLE